MNTNLFKLTCGIIRNIIASQLFVKFAIDFTRPIQIVAKVNSACNSRCRMCHNWRTDKPSSFSWIYQAKTRELPAEIFNGTFDVLKRYQPNIKINFCGGEVLLKDDVFDMFSFCRERGIIYSITSNGIALDKPTIKRLLKLQPANINISLDSLDAKTYENIRGVPQMSKVLENIDTLLALRNETRSKTLVFLKAMVCRENINELCNLVRFTDEKGFHGVTFQPVLRSTHEAHDMFKVDHYRIKQEVNALIQMKNKGYDILNSRESMRGWIEYFNETSPANDTYCTVPMNYLYIFDNGDIKTCELDDEVVGNIEKDDVESFLNSERLRCAKSRLVNCKRSCTYCIKRSFWDYVDLARRYMKG